MHGIALSVQCHRYLRGYYFGLRLNEFGLRLIDRSYFLQSLTEEEDTLIVFLEGPPNPAT